MDIWGKNIPGQGNSQYRDADVRSRLMSLEGKQVVQCGWITEKDGERVENKARKVCGGEVAGSCKDSKIIKPTSVLPLVR